MNALYCALFVLMAVATVHSSPTPDTEGGVDTEATGLLAASDNKVCNNKSYKFYKVAKNWARAQADCKSNDQGFATILSQSEQNQFVADRTAQAVLTGQLWVAGYDGTHNQNFKWVPQQIPFDYTNWASGYPKATQDYQCVYLADDSTWINADCTSERFYACEICS